MKVTKQIALSDELLHAFAQLPINRSAAITQALMNASYNPDILVGAFRVRLTVPDYENNVRISYSQDVKLNDVLAKLSRMTKLPQDQVIRLCMEAYIRRV